MMSVEKLVETINAAVQKAGGEATRVWPDMVAMKATGALVWVWFAGALTSLFLAGAVFLVYSGATYEPYGRADDGLGIRFGLAIISAGMCILMGSIMAYNLVALLHPEAALVRDLLGR